MKDRLLVFLKAKGLTQAKFADSINVARAAVSHIIAGRNLPSYEFLCNTMKVYPDLNMEWLMLGIGEMTRKESGQTLKSDTVPSSSRDFDEIELFATPSEIFNSREVEEKMPEQPKTLPSYQVPPPAPVAPPAPQTPPRQRKAVRIMIFFDDGTFQEF